jgi:hypothetical protein
MPEANSRILAPNQVFPNRNPNHLLGDIRKPEFLRWIVFRVGPVVIPVYYLIFQMNILQRGWFLFLKPHF